MKARRTIKAANKMRGEKVGRSEVMFGTRQK